MSSREARLASLKLRNSRPSVFTEDQFNQSDDDHKSFYSQFHNKLHYNFEQRNEDYEEQPTKTKIKSGFVVSPSKQMAETVGFARPQRLSLQNNAEEISKKREFQELAAISPTVGYSKRGGGGGAVDYDRLYRQIKLTPMLEEKNESEQTIEPVAIDPKTYSVNGQAWSHISDHLSEISKAPLSDDPTRIRKKQEQTSLKPVGRIAQITTLTQRTYVPQIHVQQPKKQMVDSQIQTTFQEVDQDFDDHSTSKDGQVQTNFLKVDKKMHYEGSHQGVMVTPHQPYYNQPEKPKYDNLHKPQPIQSKGDEQKSEQPQRIQTKIFDPSPQKPQQPIIDGVHQFDLSVFLQLYYTLRSIQSNLRNPNLIKSIKSYLQLIATGKVDNFQYVRVPLHKKKTLKLSLLYERVSIIIIAFAYASDTISDSHRYLSNLVKYAINNYLIALKVLTNQQNKEYPSLTKEHREVWALCNKDNLNKCFQLLRDNNQVLIETIYKLSKFDSLFYQNLKKFIKNSSKFTIQQTFYFVLQYFAFFLNLCQMQSKIPFLAVAPNPYLPPLQTHKYTLVVDLTQVMCHPKKSDSFRPYSQYFLDEMSQYYEIVAFCIAFPNQVAKLIQAIDRKKRIHHKLYKHHSIKSNGHYIKDVSRLGRDPRRVVMIDTTHTQRSFQNTINVKSWSGSTKDTVLAQLCPILAMIAIKQMDVREAVNKYRDQSLQNQKSGVKYINYGINL